MCVCEPIFYLEQKICLKQQNIHTAASLCILKLCALRSAVRTHIIAVCMWWCLCVVCNAIFFRYYIIILAVSATDLNHNWIVFNFQSFYKLDGSQVKATTAHTHTNRIRNVNNELKCEGNRRYDATCAAAVTTAAARWRRHHVDHIGSNVFNKKKNCLPCKKELNRTEFRSKKIVFAHIRYTAKSKRTHNTRSEWLRNEYRWNGQRER